MKAINPATGQLVGEYPDHTWPAVEQALAASQRAFQQWRRMTIADRAGAMARVGAGLRGRREALASLMTAEMGKPITEARGEVDKCASACDWFAEHGPDLLRPKRMGDESRQASESHAERWVQYDPLGPLLAIMPWNFPFWQVIRAAVPAMLAGNSVLLKHAPNVPGCALALESLFAEANIPAGAFTALLVDNDVAQKILAHPAVAAVTLTGSERAGRAVASSAGGLLKPQVLELGGSDAFIVLDDADIASVAKRAAAARCINNGQSCIAAKRFIVGASIAREFEAAFARELAALRVGDPMDSAVQVGPLARADLRDNLVRQVRDSIRAGARLVTGGQPPAHKGFYFPPTLLADVRPGMAAFDEETFGPVAAMVDARDDADAVALTNASRYGLGASIWTRDLGRAKALVGGIEAGSVFVNEAVKSDAALPFGGIKASGYGRELGELGLQSFVNVKTVWMDEAK